MLWQKYAIKLNKHRHCLLVLKLFRLVEHKKSYQIIFFTTLRQLKERKMSLFSAAILESLMQQ